MLIRQYSSSAKAAGAAFVSAFIGMALATASADSARAPSAEQVPTSAIVLSSDAESRRTSARQAEQAAGACTTLDRPKHTIRKCRCDPSLLAGVASVDAAEILRLLLRDQGCQGAPLPRK